MNGGLTIRTYPIKKINLIVVCILWGIAGYLFHEPKVIYKTVNQPASDQQLIAFWFGDQDKTKLRNRICK